MMSGFNSVALVVAVEILGVRSLAFATGSYLSIATTGAMFAGGLVRALVEAVRQRFNNPAIGLMRNHQRNLFYTDSCLF